VGELSKRRREQAAKLAYELWERNGRPSGSAERDWLEDEKILKFEDRANVPFGSVSLEASED
jgi:hypothetical protein